MASRTGNGPILSEAKIKLVSAREPVTGTLVSNELCMAGKSASFVRHTVIDVSGTPLEGSFLPGQAFGVLAPGLDERGKAHKTRLYSIANPSWGEEGNPAWITTTCKRVVYEGPGDTGPSKEDQDLRLGVCSNYICDLRPGDKVKVLGPAGRRFLLPKNPGEYNYVFLAAGTGIAPFRAFIMELLNNPQGPCSSRIELLMGSPYRTDLLYNGQFRTLENQHSNFVYKTAISREPPPGSAEDAPPRGKYMNRVIEEQWDHYGPLFEDDKTLLYICGLSGMQTGVYRVLQKKGLAEAYFSLRGKDDMDLTKRIKAGDRTFMEVY